MSVIKWLVYSIAGAFGLFYAATTQLKWWILGAIVIILAILFVRKMVRLGKSEDRRTS